MEKCKGTTLAESMEMSGQTMLKSQENKYRAAGYITDDNDGYIDSEDNELYNRR
jgi:hypothetical protein